MGSGWARASFDLDLELEEEAGFFSNCTKWRAVWDRPLDGPGRGKLRLTSTRPGFQGVCANARAQPMETQTQTGRSVTISVLTLLILVKGEVPLLRDSLTGSSRSLAA